jgi:hypothetical protein
MVKTDADMTHAVLLYVTLPLSNTESTVSSRVNDFGTKLYS